MTPTWSQIGTGTALSPLDRALEYLRERGAALLPAYAVGMLPFTIVALMLVDAISANDYPALAGLLFLQLGALLWRWVWLAVVQRKVQTDLRGVPPLRVRGRAVAIIITRSWTVLAQTWGIFLGIPFVAGFFLSSFATPALLEKSGPASVQIRRARKWVIGAFRDLLRIMMALLMGGGVFLAGIAAFHTLVIDLLLPLVLVDTTDIKLTLGSSAWLLSMGYLLFVAFDFFWTTASVFIFYELQSRHLGADLQKRLAALSPEAPQ